MSTSQPLEDILFLKLTNLITTYIITVVGADDLVPWQFPVQMMHDDIGLSFRAVSLVLALLHIQTYGISSCGTLFLL
jgi:hypothetical protein